MLFTHKDAQTPDIEKNWKYLVADKSKLLKNKSLEAIYNSTTREFIPAAVRSESGQKSPIREEKRAVYTQQTRAWKDPSVCDALLLDE